MKEIKIEDLVMNPFTLLGKEWCLIGAKNNDRFNAMTASWGGFGVLWNKNVVTIYVRPQRYTRELIDASDFFTVAFFNEEYKKQLSVYGSTSGREIDKEKETGFHRVDEGEFAYIQEAKLVLECRKLYRGEIQYDHMIDKSVDINYPTKDYHYVYIAEIVKVLEK